MRRPGRASVGARPPSSIIDAPGRCGETGATYIHRADRYLLVAWYYPGDPNVETDETRLVFYEAPHPWGHWQRVREIVSRPKDWYCPRILAKGQRFFGGDVQAAIVTGGDYYEMDTYYRFTTVPLEIRAGGRFPLSKAEPESTVVNDMVIEKAPLQIAYSEVWRLARCRPKAMGGTEHVSEVEDATFAVSFTGRGIRWNANKVCCGEAAPLYNRLMSKKPLKEISND
ncbi:MAG: hypothetical protein JXC32_06965 [Anaerolineae bacterium]|nr:hypothetical protein [Anaerolineae bacterium]